MTTAMGIPRIEGEVPFVSTAQMIAVDRAMMDDLRIDLRQIMENAGRALAQLARVRFLDGDPRGRRVVVLAGTGGNGGGAMVCARRLHGWGASVEVRVTADDEGFAPVPRHQLEILRRMGVWVRDGDDMALARRPCLVIDGVLGYCLRGAPRGASARLIRWAGSVGAPVLSLEAPSGIDATSGTVHQPAVRATATMTLALPTQGLRVPEVEARVGELYVADIGVPPALYAGPELGLCVGPMFARADIMRVR